MLDTLISSQTRLKLLLKFFLNSSTSSYLRDLESEFGESTNAIRLELNRFEQAGLLSSASMGNKKMFSANTLHPLFSDIHNIVLKHYGLDTIVEEIAHKLGGVLKVLLGGSFARGINSTVIDLLIIGSDIDKNYLLQLIEKAESMIRRKIRYIILSPSEFQSYPQTDTLLLWENN